MHNKSQIFKLVQQKVRRNSIWSLARLLSNFIVHGINLFSIFSLNKHPFQLQGGPCKRKAKIKTLARTKVLDIPTYT